MGEHVTFIIFEPWCQFSLNLSVNVASKPLIFSPANTKEATPKLSQMAQFNLVELKRLVFSRLKEVGCGSISTPFQFRKCSKNNVFESSIPFSAPNSTNIPSRFIGFLKNKLKSVFHLVHCFVSFLAL